LNGRKPYQTGHRMDINSFVDDVEYKKNMRLLISNGYTRVEAEKIINEKKKEGKEEEEELKNKKTHKKALKEALMKLAEAILHV